MTSQSDYYQPFSSSQPILLPPVSDSSVDSSSVRWADKIRPWITGATTDDIVEADPDIVQAYQQRWQLKWNYFSDAAPQEMQKQLETVIEMDTKEMKNRVDWLSKEFERLIDQFTELDLTQAQAELTTGRVFAVSLIEESMHIQINSNLDGARQSLKNAEIVYQFTLQSFTFIVALHRRYRLGNNTRSLHLDTQRNLVTSRQVDETRSSQEHFYPLTPNGNEVPMESMSSAHPMQMPNVPPEFPQPHTSTSHIPQSQNLQIIHHYPPELVTPHGTSSATMLPNINQNQLAQQSVKSSHKTSIAALLTIGFFGASITWSTVFSGTRGNMALISWSASTFITSSVCAASASVLVTSEEEIVEKHSEVRWVVRILSRVSSLHIFAGLLLLSVTILTLDPEEDSVVSSHRHRDWAIISAGIYSLIISFVAVSVSVAVWHRFTRRQWFY